MFNLSSSLPVSEIRHKFIAKWVFTCPSKRKYHKSQAVINIAI